MNKPSPRKIKAITKRSSTSPGPEPYYLSVSPPPLCMCVLTGGVQDRSKGKGALDVDALLDDMAGSVPLVKEPTNAVLKTEQAERIEHLETSNRQLKASLLEVRPADGLVCPCAESLCLCVSLCPAAAVFSDWWCWACGLVAVLSVCCLCCDHVLRCGPCAVVWADCSPRSQCCHVFVPAVTSACYVKVACWLPWSQSFLFLLPLPLPFCPHPSVCSCNCSCPQASSLAPLTPPCSKSSVVRKKKNPSCARSSQSAINPNGPSLACT